MEMTMADWILIWWSSAPQCIYDIPLPISYCLNTGSSSNRRINVFIWTTQSPREVFLDYGLGKVCFTKHKCFRWMAPRCATSQRELQWVQSPVLHWQHALVVSLGRLYFISCQPLVKGLGGSGLLRRSGGWGSVIIQANNLHLHSLSLQEGLIQQLVQLLLVLLGVDDSLSQVSETKASAGVGEGWIHHLWGAGWQTWDSHAIRIECAKDMQYIKWKLIHQNYCLLCFLTVRLVRLRTFFYLSSDIEDSLL